MRSVTNVGLQLALVVLFAFPMFPLRVSAIAVYPFVVFSALSLYDSSNAKHNKESLFILIAFVVLAFIYLSELLFSDNLPYVWLVTQKKIGLIFIPLGFYMLNRAGLKLKYRRFINVFVAASTMMVIYCYVTIFFNGLNAEYVTSGGTAFALRSAVSQLVHLHPTYFALVIAFSVLVLINRIYNSTFRNWIFFVRIIMVLLLAVFLILLAARMVFISSVVAVMVLTLMRLKKWRYRLITVLAFIGLTVLSIQFVPTMHERFIEIFDLETNSTNVRLTIYSCAIELLKDDWLTGVSVEHLQSSLNACYTRTSSVEDVVFPNYNTHNEYLNLLCGKGVLALSSFIVLMILLFKKALRHPDFLSFCILFSMACIAENLLERQIGVFFFCIIGSLYGVYLPRTMHRNQSQENYAQD